MRCLGNARRIFDTAAISKLRSNRRSPTLPVRGPSTVWAQTRWASSKRRSRVALAAISNCARECLPTACPARRSTLLIPPHIAIISHAMPIPDYQATMLPLLRFAGDGAEHSLRDAIDSLAGEFKLSDEERRELLPSGQQFVFGNRVGWARTYMKKAGLLRTTRRGFFQITDRGRSTLAQKPTRIDAKFLDQFQEFRKFK